MSEGKDEQERKMGDKGEKKKGEMKGRRKSWVPHCYTVVHFDKRMQRCSLTTLYAHGTLRHTT